MAVWALWVAVAAATWATNARTPVESLYAVNGAGVRAGAGRVVVLLGWPVALAAIALVVLALDRVLAGEPSRLARRALIATGVLSVVLCATIFLPGVIDAKHVDAKAVNAPAAVGVAIAFGISIWAVLETGRGKGPPWCRGDLWWLIAFVVLLVASVPWVLANLGLYAGDVPGLREVFMSKQVRPEAAYPHLRAVHLGNHDGFDGLLLAMTAAVLLRELEQVRHLRTALAAYLSVILVYGLAVATTDWWGEQVVKRGWATQKITSPARPSLSLIWAAILLAGALVWLLQMRGSHRRTT